MYTLNLHSATYQLYLETKKEITENEHQPQ